MTARYFNRWIPEQSTVVDIGVESVTMQNYSQRGCLLYLIDISQKLLDTTYARLKAANLEQQVLSVQRASATQVVG